jgi:hypothetical protein
VRGLAVAVELVAACSFHAGDTPVCDGALPGDGRVADARRGDSRLVDARHDGPPANVMAVQHAVNAVTGVTVATVTLTSAVHAGDLLVCFCRAGSNFMNITVNDNINGPWTLIAGDSTSAMFYRENTAAASASGLTVTVSDAADLATTVRVAVDEFSGIATSAALDQAVGTSATASATWTSTSFNASANELVYIGVVQGDPVTFTAGSADGVAMTIGAQSDAAGSIATEYVLASGSGAQAGTITMNPAATQTSLGVQASFVR